MLKETQQITSAWFEDEDTENLKSTRKWKPKWTAKEVPNVDIGTMKWVKLMKTRNTSLSRL